MHLSAIAAISVLSATTVCAQWHSFEERDAHNLHIRNAEAYADAYAEAYANALANPPTGNGPIQHHENHGPTEHHEPVIPKRPTGNGPIQHHENHGPIEHHEPVNPKRPTGLGDHGEHGELNHNDGPPGQHLYYRRDAFNMEEAKKDWHKVEKFEEPAETAVCTIGAFIPGADAPIDAACLASAAIKGGHAAYKKMEQKKQEEHHKRALEHELLERELFERDAYLDLFLNDFSW